MVNKLFENDLEFRIQTKQIPIKGNLAYEYNPLRNYRLDEDLFEYDNYYYNLIELWEKYKIAVNCYIKRIPSENGSFIYTVEIPSEEHPFNIDTYEEIILSLKDRNYDYQNLLKAIKSAKVQNWTGVPDNMTDPILKEKGEIVDFITDQLEFDINHPASILPQASYDGSVNLIINDGNSYPKLINTRFASTGKNTYKFINRKGNSDSNIYDRGKEFKSDTSLYKIVNTFPKVNLLNINLGGNLKVGNYNFYFRLSDQDGNESDFIEESGTISIFKGINRHSAISTGERNDNSFKQIQFQLTNLDTSFNYVTVYYSRNTSEINQNYITEYMKVDRKYLITHDGVSSIIITGFENTIDITNEDINLTYSLVDNSAAHAICQNRLFLANVQKPEIPYTKLQDLSLRFYPQLEEVQYDVDIDQDYSITSSNKGYIDPLFIYNKTGYWNKELYRFGIVYIMKNGELSPVFNIRGGINLTKDTKTNYFSYTELKKEKDEETKEFEFEEIQYDEKTYFVKGGKNEVDYENVKGVISFNASNDTKTIYSLKINTSDEVIKRLQKYVKGFFFVRQNRIPMILAQGITIGIDKNSRTPTIPTVYDYNNIQDIDKTYVQSEDLNGVNYISEGFLSRYKFKFKKKSSGIWKSLLIAGAIAGAVCGVGVGVAIALTAAKIVTAGVIATIATSATSAFSLGSGFVCVGSTIIISSATTMAGTMAIGGLIGGIQEIGYSIQRLGEKTKFNGRKTKTPDGYEKVEDSNSRQLTHEFKDRVILKDPSENEVKAIICPEYNINPPYFNPIFSSNKHLIANTITQSINSLTNDDKVNYFTNKDRHFYIPQYYDNPDLKHRLECTLIAIEDDKKTSAIDKDLFRARAGEAEEAWRLEAVSNHHLKDINNEFSSTNDEGKKINSDYVRGSFGSYLAFDNNGTIGPAETVNIYFPGYQEDNIENYVQIRTQDNSPFKAVTYRININDLQEYSDQSNILVNNSNEVNYEFNIFRGDCYICQFTHRLNRNFNSPSSPYNDQIVDPDGWRKNYNPAKEELFADLNLGDVNAVQLGMWLTFTIRSNYNLNILTLDESNVDEKTMCGHARGHYPQLPMSVDGTYKIKESNVYNKGFTTTLGERYNFEVPDVPYMKNWFGTRIMYSDLFVTDSFKNGFRQFWATNYRDYTREYGQIIKLLEFRGNLICVFEHGVALIPVNERTAAGEGAGGPVYINTSNVLPENPKIISDTFGSQWAESVIKTQNAIYGVDTVGKKIWRTNGENFECISDFAIQEFLNNNITLTERELTPIIGIRNVKTHFNKFKSDIMFTFYDNLYGFEEKVWNLCYNELLQKWITFYSWVPSYSENIHNQFFSFDRNTSKWISKLGISNSNSDFKDGVCLTNNVIENNLKSLTKVTPKDSESYCKEEDIYYPIIGKLSLENRTLPTGDGVKPKIEFELIRDNYGNYKNFKIIQRGSDWFLCLNGSAIDLCTEKYQRVLNDKREIKDLNEDLDLWKTSILIEEELKYIKNDRGIRLPIIPREKEPQLIYLLNIRAKIDFNKKGETVSLKEAYENGFINQQKVDSGYYQSVVAVIPKYNMQFLTTDFWKHGQAGIIDIADKIRPTYWYGKQHPFEFEFIVADNADKHKVFNNLKILSNKAAPESFHYEVIGECYEFAKDKKNMYIRQEATKELYQYNNSDIVFDHNYFKLKSKPREIDNSEYLEKSTIFPLYYTRQDTINEVEDSYREFKDHSGDKNFSQLAGAEIVHYNNLDEYRIWNHSKAVDITKEGLLRGNMQYKEDNWNIQINPINYVQKNETLDDWENKYRNTTKLEHIVPAELNLFKDESVIPENRDDSTELELPTDWTRNIVSWNDYEKMNKEVKLKDKFLKVRIRYSGEDLAIISAVNTLYSISFS